jgi:hypothetical protein
MKHRSRTGLVFFVCALGLLSLGSAGLAQEPQWQPTIGFGGVYTQGAWTPVFVDVANSGPSLAGEIRVPIYVRTRVDRREINYVVPVELPQHSQKRYLLYVPPEELENIYLAVGGRQFEQALPVGRGVPARDTLAVVLGGDPGLLNFLSGTQAVPASLSVEAFDFETGETEPAALQVGHAKWDSLPDSWLGWGGVDAVVLGDAEFAAAPQECVEALLEWVELGGTLVVPGGATAPRIAASPVGPLLPIDVQRTKTIPSLEALAGWTDHALAQQPALIGEGPLAPGATVLCGSAGQPLIAVRPFGAGRIAMTAFDYSASPVKYWDGQTAMWQRLLAQAPAPPSVTEGAEAAPATPYGRYGPSGDLLSLADAATYAPAATLPPFWLLLGFLGAYIIVLVPVNYGVLNRFDRRELAWVTTPAIVLAFTLGAYGVGFGMRGRQVIFSRLGIIEAVPGADRAWGHGYLGLFSPSRTNYDLTLDTKAAVIRDLTPGGERTRGAARVVYGATPRIEDLAMNMWTSRAFATDFAVDLQGEVEGVIEWTGSELGLTLTNNTAYRLRDCRVVWQSSLGKTKSVKPGETASWLSGGGKGVGDRDVWQARQHLGGLDVEEGISAIALRALFGSSSHTPQAVTGYRPPLLLASIDDSLVPVTLDVRGAQVHDLNFLVARLPVRLAPGRRIAVPAWLIADQVVAADAADAGGSPWDPGLTISGGGFAVTEFRVPLSERGGEALALTLNVSGSTGSGGAQTALGGRGMRRGSAGSTLGAPPGSGAQPLLLSAFDFERREWAPLLPTFPTIVLPNPASSLSPDGRVLVKFEAQSAEVILQETRLTAEVQSF